MTEKPDEIVAEKIVDEFQKRDLIRKDKVEDFRQKFSNGDLSVEDWKLMAELTIEEEEGNDNAE